MKEIILKKWFLLIFMAGIIVLTLFVGGGEKQQKPETTSPHPSSTSAPRQIRQLPALGPNDGPWDCLEKYLPVLVQDTPRLKLRVELLLQTIGRHREFTKQSLQADHSGITIDFIYGKHPGAEAPTESIMFNQARTEKWLEDEHYDLVGIEARYSDDWTPESFRESIRQECMQACMEKNLPFSEELVNHVYSRFMTEFGVFRYLQNHLDIPAFGIEVYDLHALHSEFLSIASDAGRQGQPLWDTLNIALRDARSEMSIARAIYCAKLHNAKRIGIPYGSAHLWYIASLRKKYHLQGRDILVDDSEATVNNLPANPPLPANR